MNEHKRTLAGVFVALVVIFIGLFLLCAQNQPSVMEDEEFSDNEDFRQELMDMLDLEDEGEAGEQSEELTWQDDSDQKTEELTMQDDTEEDVLSFFSEESSEPVEELVTEPTATADNMGISQEMFVKIQSDVMRLENKFNTQSSTVDSLRRIIENRNVRIRDLENRVQAFRSSGSTGKIAPPTARYSQKSSVVSNLNSDYRSRYEAGRTSFERFNYEEAIQVFSSLLQSDPSHSLADNCQYWIGECYYGLKQYDRAILEFQKVFAYSQNDKHDDAQLMIGLSYVKSGQTERAKSEFQTFLNTYIGSEYTSIARRYTQNI